MHGIDVAFVGLQVIAFVKNLGNGSLRLGNRQKIVIGHQRRLAWSHVSKDNAARFPARIGRMPNRIAARAAARLSGHFQNPAANIIKPSVIEASQSAVLDPAVTQVGAAVGTVKTQQPGNSRIVTEKHQLFAQYSDFDRSTAGGQLLRKSQRLPVTPHQLAARGTRAGLSKQFVFFSGNHDGLPQQTNPQHERRTLEMRTALGMMSPYPAKLNVTNTPLLTRSTRMNETGLEAFQPLGSVEPFDSCPC